MYVLVLLALGLVLGTIIKKSGVARHLDTVSEVMVYLLLFLLGVEISSRMNWVTLKTIGIATGLLTVGSVAGSILTLHAANKLFIRGDNLRSKK